MFFSNHGKEDEIYPLTTIEIAEAQKRDQNLKIYYKYNTKTPEKRMSFQLIENTKVLYKDNNQLSQHLYSTGLLVGITTTSSTLGTHVSKRQ
jgi:hypothetical protein